MNLKKILIPLSISFTIFIISFIMFYIDKSSKENIIYSSAEKTVQSNYVSVQLSYKKLTDYFYNDVFNEKILKYIYENKINTLKKILEPKFENLYNQNITKIIVLDLNGKPILILSKDKNSSFNINYVDSDQIVYPLKYKNNFIGNVYLSVPFSAIQKGLNYIFDGTYLFLLKENPLLLKLKSGTITSITSSQLSNEYYYEYFQVKDIPVVLINNKLKDKISKMLGIKKPFSLIYNYNGNFYMVTFLPIFSLNKTFLGYLIRYYKEHTYPLILKAFYINVGLSFLISVLLGIFSYTLLKNVERFKFLSETDRLTELYNKGKFNEVLQNEIERAKRYKRPLSLIIFDIDDFKKINDTYGHKVGDEVLKELAKLIKKNIRKSDFAARWGGEEFVILAPETDIEGAKNLAEKLRKEVEKHKFPQVNKVTISLGVAQYNFEESPEEFVVRADMALYKAKEGGRNRVEVAI